MAMTLEIIKSNTKSLETEREHDSLWLDVFERVTFKAAEFLFISRDSFTALRETKIKSH